MTVVKVITYNLENQWPQGPNLVMRLLRIVQKNDFWRAQKIIKNVYL